MDFLVWHYTEGLNLYLWRWHFYTKYVVHYFSIPLLITTLFSPWKRLIEMDTSPGFNIAKYFRSLTFNLISRGIGAVVRFILFWIGSIIFLFVFFGGAFGIILWLIIPPLALSSYLRYKQHPEQLMEVLIQKVNKSKNKAEDIFDSEPGKFFMDHIGIKRDDFIKNTKVDTLTSFKPKSFEELIAKLVKRGSWSKAYLRKVGVKEEDLVLTAKWWDENKIRETDIDSEDYYGRPGIGLELLFGYTPNLNQYSIDLSAPLDFSHRLIGREQVVSRMERALSSGSSVLLVGKPGVGKKTVVLEFAHRTVQGKLGEQMSYRRILEFDYNFLLSKASDLNEKKAKLAQILYEASYAGNIVLMIRDIHRLTNKEVEGYDFTDIFEEYMEEKELKIIAVSTPVDYERYVSQNLRLRKFLKEVTVSSPTKDQAMEIIVKAAMNWEMKKNLVITVPALRKILVESDKYITEVPFPEKALELLDAVVAYKDQKGEGVVSVEDSNIVLAEKTGISFAHLTASTKKRLSNLEETIHKRLINQDSAVNLIAKSLRSRTVGVKKEDRPVGSFLFLGPTGVGKTETAKVLSRVYYGSQEEIIRFDIAEYAGREGLERLIGSVSNNQPGRLTTAIKNKPASLLLLDEIEKAPSEVYNLLLSLLDEGSITDAFGRKVNCRNLFVIATSNAGAEYIRKLVSSGVRGSELQEKIVNHVLEKGIFTPEFLNRFDGVVVYEPLKADDLVKIAKILLLEMAEKLKEKNIYVDVADNAAQKIAKEGYDPAFGARPMKRIIDLIIGDLIGKAIINGEISPEDKIQIVAGDGKEEYHWEKVS